MICSSCHNETDAASLFCHVCDAYRPDPNCGKKANVATRLLAHFLDVLVAFAILFTIALVSCGLSVAGVGLGGSTNSQVVAVAGAALGFMTFVVAFVGYVAVLCVFLARGKSPGKALAGIRVVDKRNGSFPGFGRMLLRETLGKFVSGLFLGLGYFFAIFDRDSQAWHDKIAGTVVLKGGGTALQTGAALQSGSATPVYALPIQPAGPSTSAEPTTQFRAETLLKDGTVAASVLELASGGLQVPAAPVPPTARPILKSAQAALCPKCGTSADNNDRFCTGCGTPLSAV